MINFFAFLKLGLSLMPCQGVLVLIAGIIYSRPVLDNSLTTSHKLFSQAMIIMIIMKSFISDPEQFRVTLFQSYIH